jgi:hypothetical protein
MSDDISNMFKVFLLLQENAIDLVRNSITEFKEETSKKELYQALEILESEYKLYLKKGEERFSRMLVTQDELIQTQKCPKIFSSIYSENLEKGYEVIEAILAIQDYFNSLLEKKLPEGEIIELRHKLERLLSLFAESISVVKKYIEKFRKDPKYLYIVKDLEHGQSVLQGWYDRIKKAGIVDLSRHIKKKLKRGGFGLSRGFGEFLYALPKDDEEWSDEVMDAVRKIERYYRSM